MLFEKITLGHFFAACRNFFRGHQRVSSLKGPRVLRSFNRSILKLLVVIDIGEIVKNESAYGAGAKKHE